MRVPVRAVAFALAMATAACNARREAAAQSTQRPHDGVVAIIAPRAPLPAESASVAVTRFSFIAYGDTRSDQDGEDVQFEHSYIVDAILRQIAGMASGPDPVRFVLQSGDAVVDGGDARQWNVSFIGLVNRITDSAGVPYFLAPGNHDLTSAPSPTAPLRQPGLRNYLAAIAGLIPPDGATRRLAGYPTYAVGYGNTFVIAFDSNIAGDDRQYAWIAAQLAGLDRTRFPNIVALFHHPVFSSGPHGAAKIEHATADLRAKYMPLFRRHHVRLLIAGHEHLFEHWVERWKDSTGMARRMDQVVSGGGGAPLYPYAGEPDTRAYLVRGEREHVTLEHLVRPDPAPNADLYHFLVVRVDGERITVEYVGLPGGRKVQPYPGAALELADPPKSP